MFLKLEKVYFYFMDHFREQQNFEIESIVEQKPFENPAVGSFFTEWCKRNNHIEPKVIERNEWEEKENILEKRDDGKGNLYIPKDLQLWEMIPIIETIDKDTFINKPERQGKVKEELIELGKTFKEAGIYIAKRLDFINEGNVIASTIAKEFYNYGESIINGKKSKKDKNIEEIKLQELTEEETNKVDCFLAGEELSKSIKNRADKKEINIEIERQKTLNRFFKVSEEAFKLQQRSESGSKFISKINETIKREIETPHTELYNSIFRRGMDMLQEYMPFDKLPDEIKNELLHWRNGEKTLRQALQIDKLKSELDLVRLGGDVVTISNKEREITDKIQKVINKFKRNDDIDSILEMITNQEINCLGASMLGGALMQEVGLNYLVGRVRDHSILFLITSDDKIEWRDMLKPKSNALLNNEEIEGQKNDGLSITVGDILEFSKNPKSKSLTFNIKGEDYRKKFPWIKEGQRQFVNIFKPEEGQQIDVLNSLGSIFLKSKRYKEAVELFHKAITIDPNYAYLYKGLGSALLNLERKDEAIKAYYQAIIIDPEYTHAFNSLGNALLDVGRENEAFEMYKKFIDLADIQNDHYLIKRAERILGINQT